MLVLRSLHLLSLSIFMGSLVSTLVVKWAVERAGDAHHISSMLRALISLDKMVIGPSALALALTGVALASGGNFSDLMRPWIVMVSAFWLAGLVVAHTLLVPGLKRLATQAQTMTAVDGSYIKVARRWNMAQISMVVAMGMAVIIAVFKPLS